MSAVKLITIVCLTVTLIGVGVQCYPAEPSASNLIIPRPEGGELQLAASPPSPKESASGKCKYQDSYGECVQITSELVAALTG